MLVLYSLLTIAIGLILFDLGINGFLGKSLGWYPSISEYLSDMLFQDNSTDFFKTSVDSKHAKLINYRGYANKKMIATSKFVLIRNSRLTYMLKIPIDTIFGYSMKMNIIDDTICMFFNYKDQFNYLCFDTDYRDKWVGFFKSMNIPLVDRNPFK